MIDLSHDNSGKDPERQPAVAAALAEQVAAGQRAIVRRDDRVLPGRRAPGPRRSQPTDRSSTASRSPTAASAGRRPSRCSTRWPPPCAPRRHAAWLSRPVRIAVIGVGLIGGSVALAARERLGATVTGYDASPGGAARRRCARGAIDARRRLAAPRRSPDAAGRVRGRPGGRAARVWSARRWPPRRPTASSPTSARPSARSSPRTTDPRFVGGHPAGRAPRPPASSTPARTCSTAPPGT